MATSSASLDRSPRRNWVETAGGLPPYIRKIARAIEKDRGIELAKAIPYAIGRVKRWAAGGDGVTAATKAKAAEAIAAWEKLKAKNAALRESVEEDAVDDLAMTDAELLDAVDRLQESALDIEVDLGLVEAPADLRPGRARQPGESMQAWQRRTRKGMGAAKAPAAKRTRGGGDADFESKHPRGRGGSWTFKQGDSGDDVRTVQKKVGAKVDGAFGSKTKQAVMDYQRKHGLTVDGIIGHQTAVALAGNIAGAKTAKVGGLKDSDRAKLKLTGRRRRKGGAVRESVLDFAFDEDTMLLEAAAPAGVGAGSVLDLQLGDDGELVEAAEEDAGEIHEQADLMLVESVDGHVQELRLVESAVPSEAKFNTDGTIDFVILRPCNGRGVGSRIYEADMLRENADVWAGVSAFDNHESEEAKRARRGIPRPPSQLAGECRESWWDPSFSTPKDGELGFGQGAVIGRFMLTEDMEKLVRRLPRAVKTSINAQATRMSSAIRRGKRGMLVEGIARDPENMSIDLVTKAGAGGQVASLYRQMAA